MRRQCPDIRNAPHTGRQCLQPVKSREQHLFAFRKPCRRLYRPQITARCQNPAAGGLLFLRHLASLLTVIVFGAQRHDRPVSVVQHMRILAKCAAPFRLSVPMPPDSGIFSDSAGKSEEWPSNS